MKRDPACAGDVGKNVFISKRCEEIDRNSESCVRDRQDKPILWKTQCWFIHGVPTHRHAYLNQHLSDGTPPHLEIRAFSKTEMGTELERITVTSADSALLCTGAEHVEAVVYDESIILGISVKGQNGRFPLTDLVSNMDSITLLGLVLERERTWDYAETICLDRHLLQRCSIPTGPTGTKIP